MNSLLDFRGARDKVVIPKSIVVILDELYEGYQEAPGVGINNPDFRLV